MAIAAVLAIIALLTAPQTAAAQYDDPLGPAEAASINGAKLKPGEAPFLVSIHSNRGSEYRCAGSLVAPQWVLTAEHCVPPGPTYTVGMGTTRYSSGAVLSIAKVVRDLASGLAMIKLAQVAPVGSSGLDLLVLPLVETGARLGQEVAQAGWGATQFDGVNVASAIFPEDAYVVAATMVRCDGTSGSLCAEAPGASVCGGDSGGPVYTQTDTLGTVLLGVVQGSLCVPGAQTSISFTATSVRWIRQQIGCGGLTATHVMDPATYPTPYVGTDGRDVIVGTHREDNINSRGGNDVICSGFGVDTIYGGEGDDTIWGGGGSDRIWSQGGRDTVYGGSGADHIFGGPGDDELHGMGGQDRLYGDDGNDLLLGNHQSDKLYGGPGNDVLRGHAGKDKLYGDAGNDQLFGGDNSDYLEGGAGTDTAHGQRGRDHWLGRHIQGCEAETKSSC